MAAVNSYAGFDYRQLFRMPDGVGYVAPMHWDATPVPVPAGCTPFVSFGLFHLLSHSPLGIVDVAFSPRPAENLGDEWFPVALQQMPVRQFVLPPNAALIGRIAPSVHGLDTVYLSAATQELMLAAAPNTDVWLPLKIAL